MITLTEVLFLLGLLLFIAIILYGLGSLRESHNRILERERKMQFYQKLAELELAKAKEAWTQGDVQAYELHRSSYNSLVVQHRELETKG